MIAITYSAARANLASTMNRVCDDHNPLIITRNKQMVERINKMIRESQREPFAGLGKPEP